MPAPRGRVAFAVLVVAVLGVAAFVLTRDPASQVNGTQRGGSGKGGAPSSVSALRAPSPADGGASALSDAAQRTRICESPTGNAALVNGSAITVERLCNWLSRTGAVNRDGEAERGHARSVLERMIDAMLVSRELEKAGLTVGEAELRNELRTMSASAADVELLTEQLRERLEVRALTNKRFPSKVTKAEIDAEIARGAPGIDRGQGVRVEGWVRRVAPTADATAQAVAEQAAKDFVAAVANEAPDLAARRLGLGGLPPFIVGQNNLEPNLEETAQTLPVGAWSQPIRTRVGWTIIRVLGREEGIPLDDAKLRERVRQALETRKLNEARDRVLMHLRATAQIEILVDL